MSKSKLAKQIRTWRMASGMSQKLLAASLGVSQQAISYWEKGVDRPSSKVMSALRDLMMTDRSFMAEKVSVENAKLVSALVDIEGTKLVSTSRGFAQLWPSLLQYRDTPLENHLVGELAILAHDRQFRREIMGREIIAVTGISDRHLDFENDHAIRHRWHLRFRSIGFFHLGEMIFEPCDPSLATGIDGVVRLQDVV